MSKHSEVLRPRALTRCCSSLRVTVAQCWYSLFEPPPAPEMPAARTNDNVVRPILPLPIAALVLHPGSVMAQSSTNASVTAEVQHPIAVSKTNDLEVGRVFSGQNNTPAVTDANAAAVMVQGQAGAALNLTSSRRR